MNRGCLSFMGFVIGPILVIGAIWMLSWNEGRAVQAIAGLGQAAQVVVEGNPTALSPSNEGKLTHVIGTAVASKPITDPDLKVDFRDQIAVSRAVEMYQWRESGTRRDTYTYDAAWSATQVDSSQFQHPEGHTNPPMPFGVARWAASDARLGAYTLDAETLHRLDLTTTLSPEAPDGWSASGGYLYHGDPTTPKPGDLRVSYLGFPSGSTVSVLAAQSQGGFAPYVAPNGYQLEIVVAGNRLAAAMLGQRKGYEQGLTWALRVLGFFGMFFGFAMFFGPLSAVVSVVPLLGSIARSAAVLAALVLSAPATLVVIAISWIAFRPLLGVGLLVLAAATLFGLHRLHRASHPVAVAAGRRPTAQ